jgi:hypothetical protein
MVTHAPSSNVDVFNQEVADRFRLAADLLETQQADPYRVRAYRRGADTVQQLREPASAIYRRDGLPGLMALPAIGEVLSLAIADLVDFGHWRWLDRLQGQIEPEVVLATVAGIGAGLAERIHDQLGIETLEELEAAAADGRLATVEGFGPKRVRSVKESLAGRFRDRRRTAVRQVGREPSTGELIDINDEYRDKAGREVLPMIAPRRFNPSGARWLPILHTTRGRHHYTAMYSNTARAHSLGHTHDWVVIYADAPDQGVWTVVTETRGPRAGQQHVRGRAASG